MNVKERLRPLLRTANRALATVGVDSGQAMAAGRDWRLVRAERKEYERQRTASAHPQDFPITDTHLIFEDRYESAGSASGHYFHQDLLVAREVYKRKPTRHVDVGSSIYGLVSHLATFREVEVLDIRPMSTPVDGITFIRQDVMALGSALEDYADSVSCLHALEHFGLGRYGDPIDYEGWRKGLRSLTQMLTTKGTLYLSVPTGERQRVEFNAHRVFSLPFLRGVLEQDFTIERLAFVNDSGGLDPYLDPYGPYAERSFGAQYGCSIWVLVKN